jgi:hypothetical protein
MSTLPGSSFMNSARARLNSASASLGPYKSYIQLGLYVIVAIIIVYTVYTVLFPAPDKYEQLVLTDTRGAEELKGAVFKLRPPMHTGGEYSLQTWVYINDWDHRSGSPKHVFTIASDGRPGSGRPEHATMVGILYPNENKMMIRVYQETEGTGAQEGLDMTIYNNLNDLFRNKTPMVSSSMDYPICDITDLDLQRWLCLAIVVNGRVVDVYMDGKLARSCVCPGIPTIESGSNSLTLCKTGVTFGGLISTTRFYGYALSPARVYDLYQEGPAEKRGLDKRYGFIGWLAERLGLNISYQGASNKIAK